MDNRARKHGKKILGSQMKIAVDDMVAVWGCLGNIKLSAHVQKVTLKLTVSGNLLMMDQGRTAGNAGMGGQQVKQPGRWRILLEMFPRCLNTMRCVR